MSEGGQINETVGVSREGVTVSKQFEDTDEFPVPTVRFRIVNNRDQEVFVQVIEDVPEPFGKDSIGFTPEHGEEYWNCTDDRAVYERELDAREKVETLYAIRIDDNSRAGEFMKEPALGRVQLVADGDGGEGADDRNTGDGTAVSTTATDDSDGEATLGLDVGDETVASGEASSTDGTPELREVDVDLPPSAHGAGPETGSVVERLVEELSRGDVDPEHRDRLREELDLGVPTELATQIEQLQSRVDTVTAYTEALEEFLDENGAAQELIRDYKTQVQVLREDVATLRQHTRSNAGAITKISDNYHDLADHVDEVEQRLAEVADHAETVEESLAETDDHLDAVEGDLRDAEDRIDHNAGDIANLDAETDEIASDLESVEGRVTDAEDDIESLESELESVEGRVTDAEDDIESLESELESVEERVGETEADVTALEERAADAEDDIEDLQATTDANRDAIKDVDDDVDGLADDIDAVEQRVTDTEDGIADVESYVERVESDLDSVEERVSTTENGLVTVEERVSDVESGLEEFEEWRDQLGEMFK